LIKTFYVVITILNCML